MKIPSKITLSTIAALLLSLLLLDSCKKNRSEDTTTGKTTVLALMPSGGNEISGSATIEENADHTFNIAISLSNTVKDSTVYLDVHNGNFEEPFGKHSIDLGSIKCTGGPVSNITNHISHLTLPDLTRAPISYDSILTYKAFINVSYFKTPHNVSTSIAHVDL